MSPAQTQQQNCHAWIEIFTRLHSDGVPSQDQLERITAPEVRFRDPFNELQGCDAIQSMLAHTREQIQEPRFRVLDTAVSDQRVYLKWQMNGRIRLFGEWKVSGMSELQFDSDGKLTLHQDYWDASEQFYFHLPVIGRVLSWIRSFAAIKP